MLNYNELKDIARLKRLSVINAEKDYLQELILFVLYSRISRELVFKGGTCLYKVYKLNRFSEDLDFTLTKKMDIKKAMNKLSLDFKLLNVNMKIKEIKDHIKEKNVRLLFNGPLYHGNKEGQCFIPLNISLREPVILEPNMVKISSLYKEITDFNIFVMDKKEILAEKVRAILTRDKARDIYDLWFLLKNNTEFDIALVNKKLKLYNIEFGYNKFFRSISRKKGLWEIDLKNLILGELPKIENITMEIKKYLNK